MDEKAYVEMELESFGSAFPDAGERAIGVVRLMLIEAYRAGQEAGRKSETKKIAERLLASVE